MRKSYFYQLDLQSNGSGKNIVKYAVKFDPEVNKSGVSKLYVVKAGKEFVYVGIAKQGISGRLRYGFHPTKHHISHGYHGYQWKNLKSVDIYIWLFPEAKNSLEIVESLEAELVFLIRKNTGAWPKFQTEIHFRKADKKVLKEAQELYRFLKGR